MLNFILLQSNSGRRAVDAVTNTAGNVAEGAVGTATSIWNNFSGAFNDLASGAMNVVAAILILLIGMFIAKLIAKAIKKVLEVVKLDKLDDKLREVDLFSGMDINLTNLISKLVYYLLMLFVVIAAVDQLGVAALSDLLATFVQKIPQILAGGVIFAVGMYLANIIKNLIKTTTDSLNISTGNVISTVAFYALAVMVTLMALDTAGIDTGIIRSNLNIIVAAVLGAFALGYGLSSKPVMSSLISSFYTKNKITVGQRIKIGDVAGEVIKMDQTSATVKSGDKTMIVPLSKLAEQVVEIS